MARGEKLRWWGVNGGCTVERKKRGDYAEDASLADGCEFAFVCV
jgi:hypothetical protein